MKPRSTLMFFTFYFLAFSVYGQSKKANRPNLKGTTLTEYYVTVKFVDKEPKFKPTYLFATKLDPKQRKWNLDTNKINIDNYFLTKQNIHHVGYLEPDCACNLFGDTTGNGVIIVYLKPSLKLVTVKQLFEASNIPFSSLDKDAIIINGRVKINDNIFIDSEAEIHPTYKIAYTHRNGPLDGYVIMTCTPVQLFKYGM